MPSEESISVRVGDESTWQCRQTWLQSLVKFTCKVSMLRGASLMLCCFRSASKLYFECIGEAFDKDFFRVPVSSDGFASVPNALA